MEHDENYESPAWTEEVSKVTLRFNTHSFNTALLYTNTHANILKAMLLCQVSLPEILKDRA